MYVWIRGVLGSLLVLGLYFKFLLEICIIIFLGVLLIVRVSFKFYVIVLILEVILVFIGVLVIVGFI